MFISHATDIKPESMPPEFGQLMNQFVAAGFSSGKLKSTGGLLNTADAARLKLHGGKLTVKDGPFTETKELIGGYAIVEVKDREEAMDLATQFMELHRKHWPGFEGESEIRPMQYFDAPQ
jgi:hypothetical protein